MSTSTMWCEIDELPDVVCFVRSSSDSVIARFVEERRCVPHGKWKPISNTQETRVMYCDCGERLCTDERGHGAFPYTRLAKMPRFCPECGCRLVGAAAAKLREDEEGEDA